MKSVAILALCTTGTEYHTLGVPECGRLEAVLRDEAGSVVTRTVQQKGKTKIVDVLKPGYERRAGKATKWYGCFRDEADKTERVPLYADKAAAKDALRSLIEAVVKARKEGADPYVKHRLTPLAEHVAALRVYLAAKGSTDKHLRKAVTEVEKVIAGCGFASIADISASRVMEWLAERRKDCQVNGKFKRGLSVCGSNHFLRSAKSFTRWLLKDRRGKEDVLQH